MQVHISKFFYKIIFKKIKKCNKKNNHQPAAYKAVSCPEIFHNKSAEKVSDGRSAGKKQCIDAHYSAPEFMFGIELCHRVCGCGECNKKKSCYPDKNRRNHILICKACYDQ